MEGQRAESKDQRAETKKTRTELIGMKAICTHMCRSESTVLILHRDMGLPMRKIGGIWESDTEVIAAWKRKVINGEEKRRKT